MDKPLILLLACGLWLPAQILPGILNAHGGGGGGGLTFGSANTRSPTGFGTQTTTLSVTAGDLVLVCAADYYGGVVFTVSDSQGNSYTVITDYTAQIPMEAWWTTAASTGTLTISVADTHSGGLANIGAIHFSGQNASPIVGYAAANSTTSPLSTGTFSAGASAGQGIVVFGTSITSSITWLAGSAPSGLVIPTNGQQASNGSMAVEYVIVSGTQTSANIAWTGGNFQDVIGVVIH
jgi:hypothetical protein